MRRMRWAGYEARMEDLALCAQFGPEICRVGSICKLGIAGEHIKMDITGRWAELG